jgi:glycosyltransferase involved in cell wall biosynthesis
MAEPARFKLLLTNPHFHYKSGGVAKTIRALIAQYSGKVRSCVLSTNSYYSTKSAGILESATTKIFLDRIMLSYKKYIVSPCSFIHCMAIHPDIIHVHSYRNFQGDVAMFFGILSRKPILLTTHASIIEREGTDHTLIFKRLYDFFLKPVYSRFVRLWLVTSKDEGIDLETYFKRSLPVLKIPLGTELSPPIAPSDVEAFVKTHGLQGKFVISYVGRLVENKGVQFVIKALQVVRKIIPNILFLIIGADDGYLNHINDMIKKLDVGENVRYLGFLRRTPKEFYAAYTASDAIIYPTKTENFGYVFIEAASLSKPIITSSRFTDVFNPSDVFFFNYGDVDALAGKILQVFNEPQAAIERAQRFHQKVLGMRNWSDVARIHEKIYQFLLNSKK